MDQNSTQQIPRRQEPSAPEIVSAQRSARLDLEARQQRYYAERVEAEAAGVPALVRLVHVAAGSSGQSHHLRRFLLGLFNGPDWPFDLTRLRCLDADLQADCLAVLRMDMNPRCELHLRIEGGTEIFLEFWEIERGQSDE